MKKGLPCRLERLLNARLAVEDSAPYMPRLAALQDSNESFCIFRRFGPAASRILLIKEIELDQISKKLDALDHDDSEKPEKKYRLKGIEHRDGWDDEQQKLLLEMEEKLNIYCETSYRSAPVVLADGLYFC